ncbi:hypothetical protein G8J22_00871 [Lentilactobacillus hilgardii]|nr:hypothetical protein G8J22_00871 [Lentilactobacillus hilgardii]TDG82128.1 hypothetical protein C5L34_000417 [Lentilactobacillus hilgardii]
MNLAPFFDQANLEEFDKCTSVHGQTKTLSEYNIDVAS